MKKRGLICLGFMALAATAYAAGWTDSTPDAPSPAGTADYLMVMESDATDHGQRKLAFDGVSTHALSGAGGWVDAGTGLKAVDDGNGQGWWLVGSDRSHSLDVGHYAVDFVTANPIDPDSGASGSMAFAINGSTIASGSGSFASGYRTTASGAYSATFGVDTIANYYGSVTFGSNTTVGRANAMTIGQYNYPVVNSIFEVGIGSDNSNRATGFAVDTDGKVIAPEMSIAEIDAGANITLTTKEYVLSKVGSGGVSASTDLTDFSNTPPDTTGQMPIWNDATQQYEPGTVSGTGDVVKVGTPVDNQIGVWTGDGTLEGTSELTYTNGSLTTGSLASGETGHITMLEDPDNGVNTVTLKADASIASDTTINFPSDLDAKEDALGNPDTDGQFLRSTAAGVRSWATVTSGGSAYADVVSITGNTTVTHSDATIGKTYFNGSDSAKTLSFDSTAVQNDGIRVFNIYDQVMTICPGPGDAFYYNGTLGTADYPLVSSGSGEEDISLLYVTDDAIITDIANGSWALGTSSTACATYSLTLDFEGNLSGDTITVDGTAYSADTTITGLSNGVQPLTVAYGATNDTVTWSGTDSGSVIGTDPNYSIDMNGANRSLIATFSSNPDYTLYWSADADGTIEYPTSSSATLNDGATIVTTGCYLGNCAQTDGDYHGRASVNVTTSEVDVTGLFKVKFWVKRVDATESSMFDFVGQTQEVTLIVQADGPLHGKLDNTSVYFSAVSGQFDLAADTWYQFEWWVDTPNLESAIICLNRNCDDSGAGTCVGQTYTMSAPITGTATTIDVAGANTGTSDVTIDEVYIYDTK